MKLTGSIEINGLKIYAYHGVFEVEQKVGQWYHIDCILRYDLNSAAESDFIDKAIDYAAVSQIIKDEMKISSKLIENVAARVGQKILNAFPLIYGGSIKLTKINPPIGMNLDSVSVNLEFKQENK